MKLTLLRKGLLLVALPLCFEMSIFATLIYLQDQVEREAQRVNHNKKINDIVNLIVCDGVIISDTVQFNFSRSLDKRLQQKIVGECIADIKAKIQDLKVLGKDDPELLPRVEACETGLELALEDIKQLKAQLRTARFEDMHEIVTRAKGKIDQHLVATLRAGMFELAERTSLAIDDVPSQKIRQNIRLLLKCALGVSVLLALGVAIVFSKQLVDRLSRLSDNARRLASGTPLHAPIGGSDEVAELDKTFHSAAELIEAAKRMRQEVTAMISHDLKTPLQSVRSYLEMIERGSLGELNERGVKLLATSKNASRHMVDLIDNVLQLEKLRSGNLQLQVAPIDLLPFLDGCLDSVRLMAANKNMTMIDQYNQAGSVFVSGDEFWLKQVLVNILGNAIKYSPENTSVTVTTVKIDDKLEIRINDQGPGIPEADKKLIFERFHRVDSTASVKGTGLGLPIAKELIEMHHGSISVESESGKGSTFAVQLPLSQEPEAIKSQ